VMEPREIGVSGSRPRRLYGFGEKAEGGDGKRGEQLETSRADNGTPMFDSQRVLLKSSLLMM